MSIGLAMLSIATYVGKLDTISEQISQAEADVIKATGDKNDVLMKQAQLRLQMLKALYGLIKDFIEFWKDVIKTTMGLLKQMNELAQGAR